MKKQQLILIGAGLVIFSSLFFFGKTVQKKEAVIAPAKTQSFNIENEITLAKKSLTVSQLNQVNQLENSVSRGDVKTQQLKAYQQLSSFWDDTVHNHLLHNFYTASAAKLENSEKNLTFAAQLSLTDLRNEGDVLKRGWLAEQAIDLFQRAIVLDPENDDLKIGLGSCYVFGKGMAGDAEETMKGIQQLLQVVRKDSANMKAQLVLGIGGVISTQYDKAVERLNKVVETEPNNLEAISWLADAYAAKGDKANALKWYSISKRLVNDPAYSKEVDERIKQLK